MSPFRTRCPIALAIALAASGCSGCGPSSTSDEPASDENVTVVGFTDLPFEDSRSHGLSGISYDEGAGLLWAVRDHALRLEHLQPSSDFRQWSLADGVEVSGTESWDGEGVARTATGFYCADESVPRVLAVDQTGAAGAELDLPAHFSHAPSNRSLESLSLSPDGHYLFTMNEGPLSEDGPAATTEHGARLRLLRIELSSGEATERAYTTDPVFAAGGGDLGVSDVAALSATRVVVMERAWVPDVGNSLRLYLVDLVQSPDVLGEAALTDETESLPKELLVDLAALPVDGFPAQPEPQPTRVLANFERLALGPVQGDGSRLLFLQADDNSRQTQLARLLVLGVEEL